MKELNTLSELNTLLAQLTKQQLHIFCFWMGHFRVSQKYYEPEFFKEMGDGKIITVKEFSSSWLKTEYYRWVCLKLTQFIDDANIEDFYSRKIILDNLV